MASDIIWVKVGFWNSFKVDLYTILSNLYDEIRERQKPNNVAAVETGFQHKQLFELINWVTAVVLSAVLGQ